MSEETRKMKTIAVSEEKVIKVDKEKSENSLKGKTDDGKEVIKNISIDPE